MQRRAARFVFNDYTTRTPGCVTSMMAELKWETLQERRSNLRLIMLYRIVNKLVDIDSTKFFRKADTRTRGANRLFQEHSMDSKLHNSFFPKTISQWNTLPTSVTDSPSLEGFKSGLGCNANLGPSQH